MTRYEEQYELVRPVFLVGFMGAGKTSTARRLARMCRTASIDTDRYIERREGRTISEIYSTDGEETFRMLETSVLRELVERGPFLVSCGGDVVESPESCALLKRFGTVVYLRTSADEASERISDYSHRPLFGDLDNARRLNAARAPRYEEIADVVVESGTRRMHEITRDVMRALIETGALCIKHE